MKKTIKECINENIYKLEQAGIENARLNAELIMCKVLNINRTDLIFKFSNEISTYENQKKFDVLIKRRALREPLQYIEEKVKFYDLDIIINNDVLIPRPETEELVDIIIKSTDKNNVKNILDIGTGSGCISLVLAKYFHNSNIIGIDKSQKAIKIAAQNKKNLNFKNIQFINIGIEDFNISNDVDIIVSNPPYVSKFEYEKLDEELYFEPKIAITDNEDGLYFYKIIYDKIQSIKNNSYKLFFEIGYEQFKDIRNIFQGFECRLIKDMNNKDRFICLKQC